MYEWSCWLTPLLKSINPSKYRDLPIRLTEHEHRSSHVAICDWSVFNSIRCQILKSNRLVIWSAGHIVVGSAGISCVVLIWMKKTIVTSRKCTLRSLFYYIPDKKNSLEHIKKLEWISFSSFVTLFDSRIWNRRDRFVLSAYTLKFYCFIYA